MGYIAQVDNDVQAIDEKLDEIEEILLGLPIRPGHKKVIQRKINELFTEIETGVEMSAVDYE